jgi:hypothetical protein
MSAVEKEQLVEGLRLVLPGEDYVGEDKQWQITYHDMEEDDFFQVDLTKKGDTSFDKFVWCHILYKQEKPEFYGSEEFEGYEGMGLKDKHYFILVGNMEIRLVADSDEFEDDKKIKDLLRAFKLSEIEKL